MNRWGWIVGAVLLVGLVFGNWIGQPGRTERFISKWLGGLAELPISPDRAQALHRYSLLNLLPLRPDDTVLLGDSLTQAGEWAEWLGAGHVNRGVNGERLDSIFNRLQSNLRICPRRIHLLLGINDLYQISQVTAEARRSIFLKAHLRLWRTVKEICPDSVLRVQALLPVNCRQMRQVLGWVCPENFNHELISLNQALGMQASAAGISFVDWSAAMRNSQGELDESLGLDGLHLNQEGYRLWVAAWKTGVWP